MAPFNGNGVFQRDEDWTDDRDAGGDQAKISATKMDIEFDNFKDGLSQCITKDGQTTVTANLPMAGFRHTGVGNAAARTDYVAAGQLQDGSLVKGTVGGTGDVITLTLTPAITAYAIGQLFWFIATAANTTAVTVNINGVGAKNVRKGTGSTALVANDITIGQTVGLYYDGTQFQIVSPVGGQIASYQPLDATLTALAALTIAANKIVVGTGADAFSMQMHQHAVCNGRLTLESGVAVSTSDQTAKTTVYLTPYLGNRIGLYDGSSLWTVLSYSEISVSLSGLAANTNFDIFVYNNAGVVALRVPVAWTNDTTRATALVLQDGVYVKTGATTDRYLGTIRTTGTTGQTQIKFGSLAAGGGEAWIGLWNLYNRVPISCNVQDSTDSWTYNSSTFRPSDNSNTMRVSMVRGLNEDPCLSQFQELITTAAAAAGVLGVALDSTSTNIGTSSSISIASTTMTLITIHSGLWGLGFHYMQATEAISGSGTVTYYGDNGTPLYFSNGFFVNGKY